jgi:hypothetical protein
MAAGLAGKKSRTKHYGQKTFYRGLLDILSSQKEVGKKKLAS